MKLCIVGLGLIGSGMARALGGFCDIYGMDSDSAVIKSAVSDGVIKEAAADFADMDAVIFATPPKVTKELINAGKYKDGATVMDACGVKGFIDEVRSDIDFVGMHPMAGKEKSGYENGDGAMFKGKNLLLIKRQNTSEKACKTAEKIGKAMGFGVLKWTDIKTHDETIAFTSQMPHLLSAIMVRHPIYEDCHAFEGGSLNDFTRIARLDAPMWAELFFQNRDNLKNQCEYYITELKRFSDMLDDRQAMEKYMLVSRQNRMSHEKAENYEDE